MAAYDTNRPFAATDSASRIGAVLMAATGTSRSVAPNVAFGGIRAAFRALQSWNDARLTRNSLAALSDRELDDIGLNRGDIERVSYRA